MWTHNGSLIWRFPTGEKVGPRPALSPDGAVGLHASAHHGTLSSPQVRPSSCPLALHASAHHGTLSSPQVGSRPALSPDGAVLYMGSFDGSLYALTSHSGQEIWRYPTGSAVHSDPVLSEDGALMASDAR